MNYDQTLYLTFLEKMYLIRRFEQKVYEFAERGLVFGSTHLEVGEEATAVGTLLNIKKEDYLIATHRGHGQELLKGTDVRKMMAEMIGKVTGVCGGRVGSMHVTDAEVNNLGAQGIIGASFPISVGVGLALNLLEDKNKILISFFGDGASNQGNFYESLNMADLWKVPVFFVCVNNQYGIGTAYCSTCNIEIYKKASFFNIKSDVCDGNDVAAVYDKSKKLIDYVYRLKTEFCVDISVGFQKIRITNGDVTEKLGEINLERLQEALRYAWGKKINAENGTINFPFNALIGKRRKQIYCGGHGDELCIYPSGDIDSCCGMPIRLGSINELETVFRSSTYQKLVNRYAGNIKSCNGCEIEAFCAGGCVADSLSKNGEINKPGCDCTFEKDIFKFFVCEQLLL